jgi:hypothetical protein
VTVLFLQKLQQLKAGIARKTVLGVHLKCLMSKLVDLKAGVFGEGEEADGGSGDVVPATLATRMLLDPQPLPDSLYLLPFEDRSVALGCLLEDVFGEVEAIGPE